MVRPAYICTIKKTFDNATMVDAKAHLPLHLFNLQTKTVTTPKWWMQRPTSISTCDSPTMVDAKAHLSL